MLELPIHGDGAPGLAVLQVSGRLALLGLVVYVVYVGGKIFLDPLKDIQGPFAARITRFLELGKVRGKRFEVVHRQLHGKYGTRPLKRASSSIQGNLWRRT